MTTSPRPSNPFKNMNWLVDHILDLHESGYAVVTAFTKKSTQELLDQRRKRRQYLKSSAGKAAMKRARLHQQRIRDGLQKSDPRRSRLMKSVHKTYSM